MSDRPVVPQVIDAIAAANPQAVAVRTGDVQVTYGELIAKANQYARYLLALGVGAESVVGVLVGRGAETLAVLLGVWKAGAAYLPLDRELPPERLGYMLATAGAQVVVSEAPLVDLLDDVYEGDFVLIDVERDVIAARPATAPEVTFDRACLAYLIFTSGSTGRPKGVQVSQGSLINLLFSMRARFTAGATHRWLAATSLSFDISAAELYLPLITGGQVVLAGDDEAGDGAHMLRLIDRHEVTHVQATPAGWKLLIQAGFDHRPVTAVTTGEACPPVLARDLYGRVSRLVDLYGPTETTIWSTGWEVQPDVTVVPIGRPVHNTRVYVLDSHLQPVAVGVTGELFIGGAGVARGYVGRPELTADRFLPELHGPVPGARMYRTGDLVRFRADGELEYLGRTDHQVKIRGYRVELGEIEEALLRHPEVRDAVVVARDDANGEKWLVAYVTGAEGKPVEQAGLRIALAAELPPYMVPAAFVVLDELPLNAAGKVDRRALPAPDRAALVADREYVAPRTAIEKAMVDVCVKVLGVAEIGVRDRLFDLGADSLRIVHVLAAAKQRGLPLTLRMLMDHGTIEELAVACGDGVEPAKTPEPAAVAAAGSQFSAAAVRSALAAHRVPGASVALIEGGEVTAVQTYGERAAGLPVTLRTPFQVGSISKHVTALIVLRLAEEGRLGLDDAVDDRSTGSLPVPAGTGWASTVRHCLANLSGISATPPAWYSPGDPDMPALSDELGPLSVVDEPGTVFRKSGGQWAVLQQLLTDVTGQPFARLAEQVVFGPLGMRDSTFEPPTGTALALGHDADGRPLTGGYRVRPVVAGAGLWSTAGDLALLATEVWRARRGQSGWLSAASARQLLAESHPGSFYGLGTVIDPTRTDPEAGHNGETPGYRALTVIRLESGDGCVVLTNSDNGKEIHKAVTTSLN